MIRRRGSGKLTVRDEQGFTVVEVLIAAAIVVVGLLALATMFPTGYSTVTKSGIQSRGLALAQQQIEYLRNQGYSNITLTTACPVAGPSGYTCTKTVTDNTPTAGAKLVTVTVTLPGAGTPCQQPKDCIVLTTIIAK